MIQCEYQSFVPTVFKNGGRFLVDDELKEKGVFPNSLAYYTVSGGKLVLGFLIAQSEKHGTWSISEGCPDLVNDLKAQNKYSNAVFYLTRPMKGFSLDRGDTPPDFVNKMSFTEVEKLFKPENIFPNGRYIVVNDKFEVVRKPRKPESKLPF